MKLAAIYERVSSGKQADGLSFDVQADACREFIEQNDLSLVKTFRESKSAFSIGRKTFQEMIAFFEQNPDVRVLVVYKLDRSARNMYDYGTLVDKLNVRIMSVVENLPDGPAGRLIGDTLAASARYFSASSGRRISDSMQAKAARGIYPNRAPIG